MTRLRARWLGRLPYAEAWDLQRAIHDGRAAGRSADDYLLLLEHPPTYTVGRFGSEANLLASDEVLAGLGAEVFRVDRGGDVTFHGPGQLVGYPIVHLGGRPDSRAHVERLQRAIVLAAGDLGVEAWADRDRPGVWTAGGKVAAVGTRVARRVTMHGFAVNCTTDLEWFRKIVPCGIPDRPVTTLSELLGRSVPIEELVRVLVPRLAEVLGAGEAEVQLGAFTRGTAAGEAGFDVDRRVEQGAFSDAPAPLPITVRGRLPGEPQKPEWMKARADLGAPYRGLRRLMRGLELHTVCEEAGCPNIYECWRMGTATFMLLGDVCTRACSFCDVKTGRPGAVDEEEPARVAAAVAEMGLTHAVLTSVDRDDLPDGGARIFAEAIRQIRERVPGCDVEVLIPDFKGDEAALETVMVAAPEVLNHNTETVLRLQRDVRTSANYGRSLALLARAKRRGATVKSGLIVGLGETKDEVLGTLADLRAVGVDIVTIGQYLRPTARHRPIDRYVHPDEFAEYRRYGTEIGIPHVESGPLVRSSYHAKDAAAAAG